MNSHIMYVLLIFMTIFAITSYYKPLFLYNVDGSLKQFGVGYKNKTIMPLWLFSIVVGILSYMAVLYYDILI